MNKKWLAIALFVSAAGAAGCKQGLGERCQVDGDCSSGICSQAVPKVCVSENSQTDQIDSMLPIDAPPADAAIDAAIDAP